MEEIIEKKPEIIDYLKCKKALNNIGITDKEITKAFEQLQISRNDLCEEYAIERPGRKPVNSVHEFLKVGIGHFEKYQGEYVKKYTATADIYLIPSQYQGLRHGKIIEKILNNRFKWFNTFLKDKCYQESETERYFDTIGRLDVNRLPEKYKNMTVAELVSLRDGIKSTKKESAWSLYEMYNENYEIYLTTEFGTLYVPIKALLDKDFNLIKKRMISYALSYHDPKHLSGFALNNRGRTMEQYAIDKKIDYENMIKPLKSKEAKMLKKLLEN